MVHHHAGTNFILSAPPLVEFPLRLPSCGGVPWRFRQFALTPPTLVSLTRRQKCNHTFAAKEHSSNKRANCPGCSCSKRIPETSGGGASEHDGIGVQVPPDVNVALHDGVVCGLHSQEAGLEEGIRAPEPLVANGDDLAVGQLVGLLQNVPIFIGPRCNWGPIYGS